MTAERTHADVIRQALAFFGGTPPDGAATKAFAALDALLAEVGALTERTRQAERHDHFLIAQKADQRAHAAEERTRQADAVSVKERIRARTAEAQLAAYREALTEAGALFLRVGAWLSAEGIEGPASLIAEVIACYERVEALAGSSVTPPPLTEPESRGPEEGQTPDSPASTERQLQAPASATADLSGSVSGEASTKTVDAPDPIEGSHDASKSGFTPAPPDEAAAREERDAAAETRRIANLLADAESTSSVPPLRGEAVANPASAQSADAPSPAVSPDGEETL